MFKYGLVRGVTLGAAIIIAVAGFSGSADAQKKGSDAKKKGPSNAWVKLCEKVAIDPKKPKVKKNVCITQTENIDSLSGMVRAAVAIRTIEGQKAPRVLVTVPLNMVIPAGTQLKVDDSKEGFRLKFMFCGVQGCVAESPADDKLIKALSKGKSVTVASVTVSGKVYELKMPLDGFASTYKGKPIDPKKYAQARKKLYQIIRARQVEYSKKVREAQKKKAGAKKKN